MGLRRQNIQTVIQREHQIEGLRLQPAHREAPGSPWNVTTRAAGVASAEVNTLRTGGGGGIVIEDRHPAGVRHQSRVPVRLLRRISAVRETFDVASSWSLHFTRIS